MVSRYQAYTGYKESGEKWIGCVPEHWDVQRLGQFFEERREKVSDKDYIPLSVTMSGIVPQLETAAKTDAGDNRKLVLKYDFVINSRSDRRGSSGVSKLNGSVSLISIVLKPRKILPTYVHHLLRSNPFQEEFYRFGKGIVADLWSTNAAEMRNIKLPIPSPHEQKAIANFLDHETAKIDTLIDKQQQLIKLLQEKRQAVISHAVTKGLNPDAVMKDSGVEWLGDVPEDWRVTRLKYHTTLFEQGWSPLCDSRLAEDGEFGVLKVGCVNGGIFKSEEHKALPSQLAPQTQYVLKKEDLLISRANTKELVGSAAVVERDYDQLLLCDKLYRLRFDKYLIAQFVAYYLTTPIVRQQIELKASGASHSMQNIGQSTIKELYIAVPPANEASDILNRIENSIVVYDACLLKADQQVKLLQERRTVLISAAVTGKIDVRNWQLAQAEIPMEASA